MKTIMEEILESRGASPKEERRLCLLLYSQAQKEEKSYEKTFALTYLADAYQSMGFPFKSMRVCRKALKMAKENGSESLLLTLQNLLGIIYIDLDDEQGAMDCFLKGIQLAKKEQNQAMIATQMANIAYIYQRVGEYEKAKEALEQSRHLFEEASPNEEILIDEGFYHLQLAAILSRQGRAEEALSLLDKINMDNENYYGVDMWMVYADCYAKRQMKEKSLDCLEKVRAILSNGENNLYELDCCLDGIEVFLQLKEYDRAKELIKTANRIVEQMNLTGRRVRIASYQIQIFKELGDTENLKKAYRDFYEYDIAFEKERKTAAQKRVRKRIELEAEYERHEGMEVRQTALETKNEVDELTQILNRRGLKKSLNVLLETAKKNRQLFSVIMFDIDFFKEFNDEYGHVEGDTCLKNMGQLLKEAAGEFGVSGRYGGDEFLLAFVDHTTKEIEQILQKLQSNLAELAMPNRRSTVSPYVTTTIGCVNAVPSMIDSVRQYVDAADQALYRIKKKTRNGFEIAETLDFFEERTTFDE